MSVKIFTSLKTYKIWKIFLMVLTNQLIYLVNFRTMKRDFFKLCVLLKSLNFNYDCLSWWNISRFFIHSPNRNRQFQKFHSNRTFEDDESASSFLLFYDILNDCHKSEEINYLLNGFKKYSTLPIDFNPVFIKIQDFTFYRLFIMRNFDICLLGPYQ